MPELTRDPGGHLAVDRQERGPPAFRQDGAQLARDVRSTGRVRAVVEDRVAEQGDMPGPRTSPVGGRAFRPVIGPGVDEVGNSVQERSSKSSDSEFMQ
ncbi:MAG: hypothetical protein JWP66_1949 [Naasia sp.]|nr:hypothetical protein [Naasia sp.]